MKKRTLILTGLLAGLLLLSACSSSETTSVSEDETTEENTKITASEQATLNPARHSSISGMKPVDFDYCTEGDSAWFFIADGDREIRFLCVETPDPDKPWGTEALEYTRDRLSETKDIYLEFEDGMETDIYGVDQAWVWLGGSLLQEELLEKGYAQMTMFSGNYKYAENLEAAQAVAKQNEAGIWGKW